MEVSHRQTHKPRSTQTHTNSRAWPEERKVTEGRENGGRREWWVERMVGENRGRDNGGWREQRVGREKRERLGVETHSAVAG